MEIELSKNFIKKFKNLPSKLQNKAEEQTRIFKRNSKDPRLHTKRLKGKELKGVLSFRVTRNYRILYYFKENKITAVFFTIEPRGRAY